MYPEAYRGAIRGRQTDLQRSQHELKAEEQLKAAQCNANPSAPAEPSLGSRVQMLLKFISDLEMEQASTREYLFGPCPPDVCKESNWSGIESMIADACDRVALLAGQAFVINKRLSE